MVKNVDQDPFHSNYGPILQHLHPQLPQQEPPWSWTSGLLKRKWPNLINQNCYEQKARMHGPILECGHPVLHLHLLHLSLPLCLPWVFMNPERKSSLIFVTALCVVVMRRPLATTCSTFHPILVYLPGSFISTGSVMMIVQSNMWTSRIVNNSILSK